MTKQNYILVFTGLVTALLLGFLLGSQTTEKNWQEGYEQGRQALIERLSDTGYLIPTIGEMRDLSGEITKIGEDRIFFKIHIFDPLADPELDERVAIINEETQISLFKDKDPAEYQKEMDEWYRKTAEVQEGDLIAPPDHFIELDINLTDLNVGQSISVQAAEDIKEMKEFTATKIIAYPLH